MLPFIVGALAAAAALAALAVSWWRRRKRGQRGSQQLDAKRRAAQEEVAARAQESRKAQRIRQTLRGHERIARRLLQSAGMAHRNPLDVAADREAVLRIARSLPEQMLETLWLAATQTELTFDLRTKTERVPVEYPTADVEPAPMRSIEQLPGVLTEQLLLDDEQFYERAATNDLLVLESYERRKEQTLFYALVDASGSMDETLNGSPRHVWARGVTVNLLLKALDGDSRSLLRLFDGAPHELHRATTPAEAEALIDFMLNAGFTGGGTNISAALRRAIADVREKGGEFSKAEILLITDGEDNVDFAWLREALGNDIRLHVCQLGHTDPAWKQIAASYRSFV